MTGENTRFSQGTLKSVVPFEHHRFIADIISTYSVNDVAARHVRRPVLNLGSEYRYRAVEDAWLGAKSFTVFSGQKKWVYYNELWPLRHADRCSRGSTIGPTTD